MSTEEISSLRISRKHARKIAAGAYDAMATAGLSAEQITGVAAQLMAMSMAAQHAREVSMQVSDAGLWLACDLSQHA